MMPPAQGESQSTSTGSRELFVWEVPGKPVVVHFPLTVIDRISSEIMRGYGANPKRSPEVGGVLMGRVQEGSPAIVRVDDFEMVPCEYRRGPSYAFTDQDSAPFEAAAARVDRVGYFRSHTREGLALAPDDLDLLNHFFDGPFYIALLVKPYATKASLGGIFVREDGTFPAQTPREFPFRLQELTGAEPPPRRPLTERRPKLRDLDSAAPPRRRVPGINEQPAAGEPRGEEAPPQMEIALEPTDEVRAAGDVRVGDEAPQVSEEAVYTPRPRSSLSWMWAGVSVLLLLLGVAAGFQGALSLGPKPGAEAGYALTLSVAKANENLNVRWDPQSPAIRASAHAVMEIEEQGISKPVALDGGQLQAGLLIYRYATNSVKFKLTVYPKTNLSVSEAVEWRQ